MIFKFRPRLSQIIWGRLMARYGLATVLILALCGASPRSAAYLTAQIPERVQVMEVLDLDLIVQFLVSVLPDWQPFQYLLSSGLIFLLSSLWIVQLQKQRNEGHARIANLSALLVRLPMGFAWGEALFDSKGRMADFRFIEVNPAFEQLTGIKRKIWLGRTGTEFLAALGGNEWRGIFEDSVSTGQSRQFDQYLPSLKKWVAGVCYSPVSAQFVLLLQDITQSKQAEANVVEGFTRLSLAHSVAQIGVWDWDLVNNETVFNPEYFNLMGLPVSKKHRYEDFIAMVHPDDRERVDAKMHKAVKQDAHCFEIEYRVVRPADQTVYWLHAIGKFYFENNRPVRVVGVIHDVTERRQIEDKLRLMARVFDTTLESVIVTDSLGNFVDVNTAFSLITGYSREEVIGKNPRLLQSGRHGKGFYEALWQAVVTRGHWSGEIWNRRKNGEIFPLWLTISALADENGKASHYVGIASDISLLKQHEKQLEHIAHYDALTGIPNRVLLADRMKQAIAQTRRGLGLLGVCYLDLDGFKPINDSLGHEAGDRVLVEIANRISQTLRSGDTVARLGGDEFVILLLDLAEEIECRTTVDRVLAAISKPLKVGDRNFNVTASIGVSLFPKDDNDPDTLLRHADQAMYIAKQSGRNRLHIYDAEVDKRASALSESLSLTRKGMLAGEFELFYQPKVHLGNGELLGAEALIRWRSPTRGLLPPADFLPCLERTEMENKLGDWVIDTALAQLSAWHRRGIIIEIGVNIAAGHLQSEDFLERLTAKLSLYPELPPGSLQIEILETAALADIPKVAGIIGNCRRMGVSFALDDFGTGYSSLAYLRRLPAGTLKIDQTFVRDMLKDQADHAIVQAVIALAQAFDRKIVAEGVETEQHCQELLAMGCEYGQGFGIARPMPTAEFEKWLEKRAVAKFLSS